MRFNLFSSKWSRGFWRTSVARMALLYIGVFSLTTAALFSSVYVLTLRAMDAGTESLMESQLQGLSEQYARLGLRGLVTVVRERSQSLDRSRAVYLLADDQLRPLVGNLNAWPDLNDQRGKWFEFTVSVAGASGLEQHPIRAALVTLPEGYRLLIGTDVIERAQLASVMQRLGISALVLLVLIGAVIAAWMNRRILWQVHAIAAAGEQIANGDFARRLPTTGSGDELDELATQLNGLLERIEQLTLALRFVIDGTAHDLRGPLNRMRLRMEQALTLVSSAGDTASRQAIESAVLDADTLLRTLEALLRIAQVQSGAAQAEVALLSLGKLVGEVAELYAPLAEARDIHLQLLQLDTGMVQGSRQLLAHAVANLLDNAVKYTPAAGQIAVSVLADAQSVTLNIVDSGPGIPMQERNRVLQRFVRLDSAQAEPGTGLGLSLVAAVCRFHHAKLQLDSAEPGLAVRLVFKHAAQS